MEVQVMEKNDGGRFLDPEKPEAGLIFDGRTSEDFKLASGTWVHNSGLRQFQCDWSALPIGSSSCRT